MVDEAGSVVRPGVTGMDARGEELAMEQDLYGVSLQTLLEQ